MGSSYPRYRDIAAKLNPDVVLFEAGVTQLYQMHEELVKRVNGYRFDRSPFDKLVEDTNGKIIFRKWDPNWGIFAKTASYESFTPGVPVQQEIMLPLDHMHPTVREVFDINSKVYKFYQNSYRGTHFVLVTLLTNSGCGPSCFNGHKVQLPDGQIVDGGHVQFLRNLDEWCEKEGMHCVNPRTPANFAAEDKQPFTWGFDAHLTALGHAVVGRELAERLAEHLITTGIAER